MRITVISPFVDRRHGTERVLAEQLTRLKELYGMEIDLYAQTVEGLELSNGGHTGRTSGGIVWHRVTKIPGPHLFQYLWWFLANSFARRRARARETTAITFSPGINAFGVDVIAVHIVFHAFYHQAIGQLQLAKAPLGSWPRRLHRRIYYRSIMALENRIYRNRKVLLLPVSRLVARQLGDYFGRTDVSVIPNGVLLEEFRPQALVARRQGAREELHLSPEDFALLLIGNDWVKKGLPCLLRAMAASAEPRLRLVVVGRDDPAPFRKELGDLRLEDRVRFLPPRDDVLSCYAAADAYVGPSIEDAFGLPILEAMACGLPVIASAAAGASEAVEDGCNGLLLSDPHDSEELARKIRTLMADRALAVRLGAAAAETARNYSWDRNAALLRDALLLAAGRKGALSGL